MTYSIVYCSRTGNTRLVAQAIRAALPPQGCLYFGGPEPRAAEADVVFAGFWTDRGSCDQTLAHFLGGLSGKTVLLFGTAGFGASPAYYGQILSRVAALLPDDARTLPGFLCQGKMPDSLRERYTAALAAHPEDSRTAMMLRNFDQARSHPDQKDLHLAARWAQEALRACEAP